MLVSAILFLLLPLQAQSAFALHTWGTTPNSTTTLLVNAIVGKENQSSVECWAVEPGYQLSAVVSFLFWFLTSILFWQPCPLVRLETMCYSWETWQMLPLVFGLIAGVLLISGMYAYLQILSLYSCVPSFHNAPAIQWVVMLTGSSNITFPNATISNLTINPGELFVAAVRSFLKSNSTTLIWVPLL